MESILVFSETLKLREFNSAEVKYIYSKEKLARALVAEENIRCLIADLPELTDENISFFSSVKNNFPMLEGAVVSEDSGKTIHGFKMINRSNNDQLSIINDFIENAENRNKRGANRFSWPLTAWYSEDDVDWKELEIFSISSGGAYLKTDSVFPKGGERAKIKIIFANFSLECECEIVDSRNRSSNYPFGFSIRFTSISEEGISVLDNLINDAVIKILMEPETEPEVPSLGGDDMTPDFTLI